ncbi:MAG: tetratricopeptide repeat protein [Bacteroidales bacterium]|nr:tetratricopeptide repeat protein [Bacteroidales bacterium]
MMKRGTLFVLTFVLVSALGCHRKSTFETLSDDMPVIDEIYELMDCQPDSALHLMQDAYRFYDSIHSLKAYRNNKFLTFQYARSIYYKSFIEERLEGASEQSFSNYLQSLWITDGLSRKRRVIRFSGGFSEYEHFTGIIYDHLAEFLYGYNTWDVAVECLEQSNECFEKEAYWDGVASNYELMGDIYLAQENRLTAVKYYKAADSIYHLFNIDNELLKFNSVLHRSITLSSMGDSEGSKTLLLEALDNSDNTWRTHRLHFGLGFVYYDLQQYDSSLYHYEQSYPLLARQTTKAYCRIIELASLLGDTEKTAHYGKLLADFYSEQVLRSGEKSHLVTLYEEYKSNTKDARNKDELFFIVLIIVLLSFIIAVDSVFIHSRAKRHQLEIANHARITASLEGEIESARQVSRSKEEQIKTLEIKLNQVISNPEFQHLPFEKKVETLMEMPICKRVLMVKNANVKAGVSYPEMVLSENQMSALVNAVDAVFPKFSVRIIEKYPRLKRSDVVYCCMYILGVSEVQAAALMGKTYQAVWTRSLKLHEIFDNKSNLQFVLNGLLKDWSSDIYA